MEPLDPHSLRRDLSAFADGELDAAAADRLRQRLAVDPAASDALRDLQSLTGAARRAVRERTPPPSTALLQRLREIAPADAPPTLARPPAPALTSAVGRSRRGSAWWGVAGQVAAALALVAAGIWLGRSTARPDQFVNRSNGTTSAAAEVIPAAAVAQAEGVHGFCSRLAEGLHTAGYPVDLAPLASSVEQDLHGDHPYPDLSAIGYRYRGAGPCGVPLRETVHLLYRAVRPGSVKAISIFVQPWHAQFPLDEGRLYTVSVATSPFPMLAWRTDRVVYFLLADDATTLQKAAALIRGTPTSRRASQPAP